jgi:cytochrome c
VIRLPRLHRNRTVGVLPLAAAIGLMVLGGLTASALRAQEAGHSIWDGVYTAAQAQRGATEYANRCATCHGDTLAGNGTDAPALTGKMFMDDWDGLTLTALFDRVHTTMPQSNPGSLTGQVAADLTAFLLSANQLPAGPKELTDDARGLESIHFEAKKPSH